MVVENIRTTAVKGQERNHKLGNRREIVKDRMYRACGDQCADRKPNEQKVNEHKDEKEHLVCLGCAEGQEGSQNQVADEGDAHLARVHISLQSCSKGTQAGKPGGSHRQPKETIGTEGSSTKNVALFIVQHACNQLRQGTQENCLGQDIGVSLG